MVVATINAQTVICLKWGSRYGAEYVNRLYSMVRRNTSRPLRFVCITDDARGILPEVELKQMPPFDLPEAMRFHPFRRMFLFDRDLDDICGPVLHLDLDVLVTGSIDSLFDYAPKSRFVTIENWTQKGQGIGNMSVFRFNVGDLTEVWSAFRPDPMAMMRKYRNSQTFVSRTLGKCDFYPPDWCVSFKHTLVPTWPFNFLLRPQLPKGTIVVAFTGKPDIDEAARGEWPTRKWWQKVYKSVRPSPWIMEHWSE